MATVTVYGPGGFDPSKPDNNAVERVEVPDEPTVEDALRLAARIAAAAQVRSGLSDDEVKRLAPLYPPWRVGLDVSVGEIYAWDGTLVECRQAHTTQADWTPDAAPALWKIHRTAPASGPERWQAGASYAVGDEVEYQGTMYRCLQAHTSQAGWEPPNVPALWQAL